ncbi:MAG: hypothetical protein F4X03_12985 [Dehalococcoidia bacterium]|nr:hypothetical protein [Dehalococcoidia bacterium]MYD29805.1 hypothetical protein [Dehalococcoidia bacterium]
MPLEELKQLIVRGLVEWALWKASEASGWLPYRTVPMEQLLSDADSDMGAVGERVDAYYRTHAMDIVRDVEAQMASYEVDGEALATLSEALRAHEYGLYRASCRVLLPELERVIREDWLGIKGVRVLSQRALATRAKSKRSRLDDLPDEAGDLLLFGWIHTYVFARFDTHATSLIPNRHAAAHGWAVYASEQDSLNTIVCADYVYRAVTLLKDQTRRPEVRTASRSPGARDASPRPALSLDSVPEMPDFDSVETPAS